MICKNCNVKESVKYSKYSSGKFCSKSCSKSYSTKHKRQEINDKVSKKLKGNKRSEETKKKMSMNSGSHKESVRNKIRESVKKFYKTEKGMWVIENTRKIMTGRIVSDETRQRIIDSSKIRFSDVEERRKMGEIGFNSSSWGVTGITESGIKYQSLFEKRCFDLLDSLSIIYEDHKYLPNSSKSCDIFINNLWIELDGVGRERRQDFLNKKYNKTIENYWDKKMEEYKINNLKLKIFCCFTDFKKFILNGAWDC
jgi:hypothetical protein